jgi:hypothetical protein
MPPLPSSEEIEMSCKYRSKPQNIFLLLFDIVPTILKKVLYK